MGNSIEEDGQLHRELTNGKQNGIMYYVIWADFGLGFTETHLTWQTKYAGCLASLFRADESARAFSRNKLSSVRYRWCRNQGPPCLESRPVKDSLFQAWSRSGYSFACVLPVARKSAFPFPPFPVHSSTLVTEFRLGKAPVGHCFAFSCLICLIWPALLQRAFLGKCLAYKCFVLCLTTGF